jgi:chromosome segregation and condensation protein ScpB
MDGDIGALGILERRERILRSFEGKHALSCLLYIGDFGPVLKTDIYRDVTRGMSMTGKVDSLMELGLVEVYKGEKGRACYLTLTPKGRCVTAIVRLMLDVAEDCPDPRGRESDMDSFMEELVTGQ